MSDETFDRQFAKVYEQAGCAAKGFSAGAKKELARKAEDLARKYGFGDAFDIVKASLPANNGMAVLLETEPEIDANLPATYRCMKESGAAAIGAIMNGAANSLVYIEQVRNGQMNGKDALVKIIGETVASAADSALKAAGETGRQIIREKYGSEEAALQAFAEQGIGLLMEKLPQSVNGVPLVESLTHLVGSGISALSTGTSKGEPSTLIVNAVGSGTQNIGKIAGEGACELVKSKFPKLFQALPKHPAILAASVVAALAGSIAVKNHIERPYKDLVANTTNLKEAAAELESVSQSVFHKQILFTKFLEDDIAKETQLQDTLRRVDEAGQTAFDAISKI